MRRNLVALAFAGLVSLSAGCPTVDLGDAPPDPGICRPDPTYFREVLWPSYLAPSDPNASCVAASGCHRQSDGRSALRLSATEPIDYDFNYSIVIRFLNCGTPEASALLTKPLAGIDPHGGGDLFAGGSMSQELFLQWLAPQ